MWPKRIDLFLASILLLFLELAFIRWIPANVRLLSYFSNFVLLSCFLGMGIGFMISLRKFRFLALTPVFIALAAIIFCKCSLNMQLDPGTFSHSVYYGAEVPLLNQLKLGFVPVIIIATVVICFTFIGLGQLVGSLFEGFAPLEAYLINIGGSIAGTLLFALFSYFSQPPVCWIAFSLILLLVLLRHGTKLQIASSLVLTLIIILLVNEGSASTTWSPYNKIVIRDAQYGCWGIEVNNIVHQEALVKELVNYLGYPVPYLLKTRSDDPSIRKVLIIGSGMGNDVSSALASGAAHVDAVEIDPCILKFGIGLHPEKPYQDNRVSYCCMDGRKFINNSRDQYDVIIYALVDSLTLFSSFSSVRLENYIYTREAFQEAARHLRPDGIMVVYNYFRQGWLIGKVEKTMEEAFGRPPLVISYPRVEQISEDDDFGSRTLQLFIAGKTDSLSRNFKNAHNGSFYFNRLTAKKNWEINGFTYVPGKDEKDFIALGPSSLTCGKEASLKNAITTDDWPFLYMRTPGISPHYMKGIVILLVITFVFIFSATGFRVKFFQPRYFFLGAAFMLLETLGVVRFSLLYGSTWFSNVVVFTTVLLMVLCANLYVIRKDIPGLPRVYILLFLSVVLNLVINPSHFIGSPALIKYTIPAIILFLPLFFAGIIFASFFKSETKPQDALASNIFGSMVGGVLEYFSLYLGFTALLFFVLALYLFSWFTRRT